HLTPPSLDGPGLCLRLLLRLRYVVFDPFESTQVRLPASHTYLPHRDAVSQADRRYPHPHLRANPQRLLALRGGDDPCLHVGRAFGLQLQEVERHAFERRPELVRRHPDTIRETHKLKHNTSRAALALCQRY